MLRFPTKYHGFSALLIWWPDNLQNITAALNEKAVLILWQCPLPLASDVSRYLCWARPFQTPLINLTISEEELWQRLDPKSCRYEIRKAQKTSYQITCNEDIEAARVLINESIRRLRYREEIQIPEWTGLLEHHDIYLGKHAGVAIAAHVIMKDHSKRAKLTLSGTADRNDQALRHLIGPLNRLLHWTEISDYKKKGFSIYDFGGINLDKESIDYSIGQFKLSFGAEVVSEPILYLARSPLIRIFLGQFSMVRNTLKAIPWPDSFRTFVRTHSRISNLFR